MPNKSDLKNLKQILSWADTFDTCMVLISNTGRNDKNKYSSYDMIIATDVENELKFEKNTNYFDALKNLVDIHKDWYFGHLSYDLKNQIEKLITSNPDYINFPDGYFFSPKNLFLLKNDQETVVKQSNNQHYKSFKQFNTTSNNPIKQKNLNSRINNEQYLSLVNKLKNHISRGDIFEVNYCYEYFLDDIKLDPVNTFLSINKISPMPFSGFYKLNGKYLFCFSPERFIKKEKSKIISQPMKGTIRRSSDKKKDSSLKNKLSNDLKERSENIMITDLVRNDLSKSSKDGSVYVEELCGIYGYKQVYQMISTIVSEKKEDIHTIDVLRNAFPMGSMTGAPKVRAMQLIDQYEKSKRGLYSGSIGYITPEHDFDFNVVIRSLFYNPIESFMNFMVGSAITSLSDPEKELEECKLKAKALYEWLDNS